MPIRPARHKPASADTKRHEVADKPTWGQGRGGRPWRRKRDAIMLRDNYTCQVCGLTTTELEVDHIVNKAQGGTDDGDNLQSLCIPCHVAKTAREGGVRRRMS